MEVYFIMNELTLIRFHATWCSPCHGLEKTLASVLPDFSQIKVVDVDIDEDVETVRKYKIRSVPTLVLADGEKEIDRLVGNQNASILKKFLTK